MNLLLFSAQEIEEDRVLRLRDRRLDHLHNVLGSQVGDRLRVGMLNGSLGRGTLEHIDAQEAILRIELSVAPPPPLPLTVVLGLPRPKMLRRILRGLAEVGVKELHLINSYRVEKSFWQSPLLDEEALNNALLSGLEQAGDTVLPRVELHRRFRPFAEDQLPILCGDRQALLADPRSEIPYPAVPDQPALAIVGPEGGFIPFEVQLIEAAGAQPVGLGARVLRVETALHCILGRHLATGQ